MRREERSWRSIFDVFDENQDGIFDRSELRVLLTKFSTATEGKITEIIELLDDDKSGEISFDEFYAFGRKLERYVRENVDPHELLKEMFEIVVFSVSNFKLCFNLGCVVVWVRCYSILEGISRRSWPSLGLSEGRGAEIARRE